VAVLACGARTRRECLVLGLTVNEAGRRSDGLRELRVEGAHTRLGGRELCVEHSDLVHGADADLRTAKLIGNEVVASGAACRRCAFSCASSVTRLVCGGVSFESALIRAGSYVSMVANSSRLRCRDRKAAALKRGLVSILQKYDVTHAGAGGGRPWEEKSKFRAQSTTKRLGRRAGKALTCYSTNNASRVDSLETFGGTKSFIEFAARARALRL
jgi:hypothetical protein